MYALRDLIKTIEVYKKFADNANPFYIIWRAMSRSKKTGKSSLGRAILKDKSKRRRRAGKGEGDSWVSRYKVVYNLVLYLSVL